MKLIILLAILATSLNCYSQEKYKTKGFAEVGALITGGDIIKSTIGGHMAFGIVPSKEMSIGGSFDLVKFSVMDKTAPVICADIRYLMPTKGNAMPFFIFNIGKTVATSGTSTYAIKGDVAYGIGAGISSKKKGPQVYASIRYMRYSFNLGSSSTISNGAGLIGIGVKF